MLIGLAASVMLHVCILMCAALTRNMRDSSFKPALQEGESSITLTFVPAPPPAKPEPEPDTPLEVEPEEPAVTVAKPDTPDEPPAETPESPARKQADTQSADMADEGVRGAVYPESEIRPRYPIGSRMRGEQGVVALDIIVNAEGRARRVTVKQSSGYPALDREAVRAVKRARFVSSGQETDESRTTLVFRFRLVD